MRAVVNFHLNVKGKHRIHYLLLDLRKMKLRELIKNLDPNKTHGPDKISICKLKICGSSTNSKLFADHKSLSSVAKNVFTTSNLKSDLAKICSWKF